MPNIGATELIIVALVIIVLFGATKLPTFARSVGRSMRIFKSEAKGLQSDDEPKTRQELSDSGHSATMAAEDTADRRQAKN